MHAVPNLLNPCPRHTWDRIGQPRDLSSLVHLRLQQLPRVELAYCEYKEYYWTIIYFPVSRVL
jgi:hypothetical protein